MDAQTKDYQTMKRLLDKDDGKTKYPKRTNNIESNNHEQLRHPLEFTIWNHVGMAFASWYAVGVDNILAVLGCITTILSIARHMHHERRYNTIEPLFAKGTEIYITFASLSLNIEHVLVLLGSKCLITMIWYIEDVNYEYIHPWLHVLVALDACYYINAINN